MTLQTAFSVLAFLLVLGAMYRITTLQGTERSRLLGVVMATYAALVLVFVIDKLSPKFSILTQEESGTLFNLVSSIILICIGYYFNQTKRGDE